MLAPHQTIRVRVTSVKQEARDIKLVELGPLDGETLPPFSAGSHIDLHLANGMIRSYSLSNGPDQANRYVAGVKNEEAGRGGSRFIHERLEVGDEIEISAPRSHFALEEDAEHSVLIAGGIGITPLMSMSRRLESLGRSWEMHYAARDIENAGFVADLCAFGRKVRFYFRKGSSEVAASDRVDLAALVNRAPENSHFYCCGPSEMIMAFQAATASFPSARVHFERFSNEQQIEKKGTFTVVLQRSGETLEVCSGQTILEALLDRGIDVSYSCTEGICSTCQTTVVSGIPDHRDMILTKEQKESNKLIMVCCSRSKTDTLVLDI
jgi:tetrachlorobenzoquinone reductase